MKDFYYDDGKNAVPFQDNDSVYHLFYLVRTQTRVGPFSFDKTCIFFHLGDQRLDSLLVFRMVCQFVEASQLKNST
jgi:hypothetical protein